MQNDPSNSRTTIVELGSWYRQPMLSWCLGRYHTLVGWDSVEGRAVEAVAQKVIRGGPTPRLTHDEVAICARATTRAVDDAKLSGAALDDNYIELARHFNELLETTGKAG